MESLILFPDQVWFEEDFGSPESGLTNFQCTSIRQCVVDALCVQGLLFLGVGGQVASAFLDRTDDFEFSRGSGEKRKMERS